MNYLKPELLILIPLLNGLGEILKPKLKTTKFLPFILIGVGFLIAAIYGLYITKPTDFISVLFSVFVIGLTHGAVAAFCSMGIFDSIKAVTKPKE